MAWDKVSKFDCFLVTVTLRRESDEAYEEIKTLQLFVSIIFAIEIHIVDQTERTDELVSEEMENNAHTHTPIHLCYEVALSTLAWLFSSSNKTNNNLNILKTAHDK